MLYRAIFGIIPMIVIALFVSGAIPISSILPGGGSRPVSEKSGDRAAAGEAMTRGEAAREAIASRIGETIGVRPDQATLLQDEFREAEKEIERIEAGRRSGTKREGWSPGGRGWGARDR